jgi:hypothetical protein
MENITSFFADFVTNTKELRENMTYLEFNDMLDLLKQANDKAILNEFLDQSEFSYYSEGTDLATAFSHAQFDLLLDPGEDFIIE